MQLQRRGRAAAGSQVFSCAGRLRSRQNSGGLGKSGSRQQVRVHQPEEMWGPRRHLRVHALPLCLNEKGQDRKRLRGVLMKAKVLERLEGKRKWRPENVQMD